MIGSLAANKRYDLAIDAVVRLMTSGYDIQLTIVGADRGERRNLVKQISDSGANSKVLLLGEIGDEQLAREILSANLFLQTSEYEGFGLGLLEAQFFGLPSVASDIEAHIQVTGGAGHFFKNKSLQDLVATLEAALDSLDRHPVKPAPSSRNAVTAAADLDSYMRRANAR